MSILLLEVIPPSRPTMEEAGKTSSCSLDLLNIFKSIFYGFFGNTVVVSNSLRILNELWPEGEEVVLLPSVDALDAGGEGNGGDLGTVKVFLKKRFKVSFLYQSFPPGLQLQVRRNRGRGGLEDGGDARVEQVRLLGLLMLGGGPVVRGVKEGGVSAISRRRFARPVAG